MRNGSAVRWLLHHVQPLWLREKLFYHLHHRAFDLAPNAFHRAPLSLAPGAVLNLAADDVGHQVIAGTGIYESAVSRRIATLARRGGLLVDVGANYGYYSVLWAAAKDANFVVAFEASRENAAALRANVDLNRLGKRITVVDLAVGRDCGSVFFQPSSNGETGQGGLAPAGVVTSVKVEMTTLLEYFGGNADIDVLKIDVEGADSLVLQGAEPLLANHRIGHIFFEHFEARMEYLGIDSDAPFKLLKKHGYGIDMIAPSEYYATKPR